MGRIQKALDKAREQNAGGSVAYMNQHRRLRKRDHLPEHIQYSETRQIELNTETLRKNRIIAGMKYDANADAYKILRTRVLHNMKVNGWNSLAITSPLDGAGKSLTALNLAISISLEVNQSVLLVDLDFRRPSIHTLLGFDPDFGITDHLTDDVPVNQIMINPGFERLVVLPGKESFSGSSEMLSSPKMVRMANDLRTRYSSRIVIFDLPPLLMTDDVLTFLPNTDAALLVVEAGRNTPGEVSQCLHLLEDHELLGTVLNKSTDTELRPY